MTNPETSETINYLTDPEKEPYLDAYSVDITGGTQEGTVRGVKLTYSSEMPCNEQ